MNTEDMEINDYYQQKEEKNEELVKCWWFTFWLIVGLVVWCFAIKGCYVTFWGS